MIPSLSTRAHSDGGGDGSITALLSALCDRCLCGVSWKRRALGGVSRDAFRRTLKKRAYGALLSTLFQDATAHRPSPAPPRNKVLMICFDLRVAGCREEAERLEELLEALPTGESSGKLIFTENHEVRLYQFMSLLFMI